MTQSGPSRLQLTAELRRLRAGANLTQKQVANALDWSSSKVIRIEKGDVRVQQTDLKALLDLYAVTDQALLDGLMALARESKKLPLTAYRGIVSEETLRYFQLEIGASIIRAVALNVVPGIFQTDAYSRAIFAAYEVDSERAAVLLESRRDRRLLLDRPQPPEVFVIIDEAALRRAVGGTKVMAEQIAHLVEMAERPNISIQVLPFTVGAHAALPGSFTHLEFPDGDTPEAIYIENARGDLLSQNDAVVTETYRKRFQHLEELALPSAEFAKFVTD